MADQSQISLQSLMDAIMQCKTDLISRLDASTKTINKAVGEVNIKLEMLGEQITEVQQRVGCNEDNIEDLKNRISHIEKENGFLKQKADSMENYSRRSNIRIVKVPEKAEGQDIIGFVQQLILHLFGQENVPHPPLIERAQRSPTQRSDNTSSSHPRPILVRFLSFQDKVNILRLSRQKGELFINKTRIHFYPDYSAELVKQRREFEPIKKKLWDMNMEYSLLYPSVLRINCGEEKPRMFRYPKDPEDFMKELARLRSQH